MKGDVTYNGYGFDECIVGRTAAYVDQNDNHIAELTVRETLVRQPCDQCAEQYDSSCAIRCGNLCAACQPP